MGRIYAFLSIALFALVLTSSSASATSVTVDLDKIDSSLAAQILDAQKKAGGPNSPAITATNVKEWAGVGEEVGRAISATAKALNVEVNEFVKTPVGWWSFFFVFWYIIGHQMWTTFAAIVIWLVLGGLIWHSFKIFHLPTIVVVDLPNDSKEVKLVSYEFTDRDYRVGSVWAHVIVFGLLSIVMMIVILG